MSMTATLSSSTCDAVDEAEVDDVDAELGVDDVAHRLLDVGDVGARLWPAARSWRLVLARRCGRAVVGVAADAARAVASLNAIQPSSAHLTRAGYFETPANATRVLEHLLVAARPAPLALHQLQERRRAPSSASATVLADDQVGQHRRRRPG